MTKYNFSFPILCFWNNNNDVNWFFCSEYQLITTQLATSHNVPRHIKSGWITLSNPNMHTDSLVCSYRQKSWRQLTKQYIQQFGLLENVVHQTQLGWLTQQTWNDKWNTCLKIKTSFGLQHHRSAVVRAGEGISTTAVQWCEQRRASAPPQSSGASRGGRQHHRSAVVRAGNLFLSILTSNRKSKVSTSQQSWDVNWTNPKTKCWLCAV